MPAGSIQLRVTAVVLTYNRADAVRTVLDRLQEEPVDEVIVVDNASTDDSLAVARAHPSQPRVLALDANVGVAARNRAAGAAAGELVLMLDDDSYPLPGAVDRMRDVFAEDARVGAVGGLVREVMGEERVIESETGSFDWFLRGGRTGDPPPTGFPAFFFPEGASMHRRDAFLEAGGFFEPYFFGAVELDLATRLVGAGWDVRYLPTARFDHMRVQGRILNFGGVLRHRIRNHLWYLCLRFPLRVAVRRIPAYLAFDLVECTYRRVPSAWVGGISDAWRERDKVRGMRNPLDRATLRRAELNRGRLHIRLLGEMALKRLRGRRREPKRPASAPPQ